VVVLQLFIRVLNDATYPVLLRFLTDVIKIHFHCVFYTHGFVWAKVQARAV